MREANGEIMHKTIQLHEARAEAQAEAGAGARAEAEACAEAEAGAEAGAGAEPEPEPKAEPEAEAEPEPEAEPQAEPEALCQNYPGVAWRAVRCWAAMLEVQWAGGVRGQGPGSSLVGPPRSCLRF